MGYTKYIELNKEQYEFLQAILIHSVWNDVLSAKGQKLFTDILGRNGYDDKQEREALGELRKRYIKLVKENKEYYEVTY